MRIHKDKNNAVVWFAEKSESIGNDVCEEKGEDGSEIHIVRNKGVIVAIYAYAKR